MFRHKGEPHELPHNPYRSDRQTRRGRAILVYLSIRHTGDKGEKSDFVYRVAGTFVKKGGRWVKAALVGTPIPKEITTFKQ